MIKVEPVQRSVCNVTGQTITTLVLEYPRAIHAQLLTHRVFSKNSSSSRAVPISAAVTNLIENPAEYIWTGKQAGMQGIADIPEDLKKQADHVFKLSRDIAIEHATYLDSIGIHKQNAARLLEPFQNIRVCLTSTEWENWDWLRIDADAQPEITLLAKMIHEARQTMPFMELNVGEWHVPFVMRKRTETGLMTYWDLATGDELTAEQSITVSMSACAQTSYRKTDYSLEKGEDMYDKLFGGKKIHASPSEHQATPMHCLDPAAVLEAILYKKELSPLYKGVTHLDMRGNFWSGNFKNFIQNRQLIPNHDKALF